MDWKALAQVLKEGCWQVMPTYRGAASPRVGQGLTEGLWHCQSTGLCVLASPVTALGVTCRARGLGLARSVSTLDSQGAWDSRTLLPSTGTGAALSAHLVQTDCPAPTRTPVCSRLQWGAGR